MNSSIPPSKPNPVAAAPAEDKARARDRMEEQSVQCPFCGQSFEISIDTSLATQRFVTDCEICCRPMEIRAECESGEIISLSVSGD